MDWYKNTVPVPVAHFEAPRITTAGMNNMNDKYLIMYQLHYCHSKYTPDSPKLKDTVFSHVSCTVLWPFSSQLFPIHTQLYQMHWAISY